MVMAAWCTGTHIVDSIGTDMTNYESTQRWVVYASIELFSTIHAHLANSCSSIIQQNWIANEINDASATRLETLII